MWNSALTPGPSFWDPLDQLYRGTDLLPVDFQNKIARLQTGHIRRTLGGDFSGENAGILGPAPEFLQLFGNVDRNDPHPSPLDLAVALWVDGGFSSFT